MTMASLISKRVAEGKRSPTRSMNRRVLPPVIAGTEAAASLEEWEAAGGASAGVPRSGEPAAERPSTVERMLLQTDRSARHPTVAS